MGTFRKYKKVTGWWVYDIITPNNLHYPGYSGGINGTKQCYERWQPNQYEGLSLYPYIEQYGWDNLKKIVLKDGLTKKEAELLEEYYINKYTELGCCINQRHSGGESRDNIQSYRKKYDEKHSDEIRERKKKYYQENKEKMLIYREEHREEKREYIKQLRSTIEGKIYNRVSSFNHNHPDRMIETPLEAKQKYLETGYIPNYIKNNDLN